MDKGKYSNLSEDLNIKSISLSPINRFQLGHDVDINALSVKYELTGGFIKNAMLSALLCALYRDALNPVIYQQDLVEGCKLQMRGSLVQRSFEEKVRAIVNDTIISFELVIE